MNEQELIYNCVIALADHVLNQKLSTDYSFEALSKASVALHNARTAQSADPAPIGIKPPESEDEAAMMGLLGTNWLEKYAPHRLKPDRPKIVDAAEPAPSVVSDAAISAAVRAFNASTESPIKDAIEAAIPFISAAKDHDTRTVIADNDTKVEEIERLKADLAKSEESWSLLYKEYAKIVHRSTALRHPDITSLMEKIRFKVTIQPGGSGGIVGTLTNDSARKIVEALFAREGE